MIEIHNIYKKTKDRPWINGITLSIKRGEIVGFTGEEGEIDCLFQLLVQNDTPEIGEISMGGTFSYAFDGHLLEHFKVRDYLSFVQTTAKEKEIGTKVLSKILDVEKLANEKISSLTLSQRERVKVASCLLTKKDINLFYKVFPKMDDEVFDKLSRFLKILSSGGKTIVIGLSPGKREWALCHRIVELKNGRVEGIYEPLRTL